MSDEDKIRATMKQMAIVFLALIIGQLSMLGVFAFLVESGGVAPNPDMHETFKYVVVVVTVISVATGQYLYHAVIKKNREAQDLDEKLANFRSSSFVVLATLEGPALFSLSIYFITAQKLYLAIFGLLLIIFFYFRPSERKFRNDFNN